MSLSKGVTPTGSGHSPKGGAASASPAEPSVPNAWPQFNLNGQVAVKLTPRGLRIMEDRHDELLEVVPSLGAFKPPKTDADGWTRFQLWALIQEFGPHISMGVPVPFETTIALEASAIEAATADGTAQTGPAEGESAVGEAGTP